MGSVRTDDLPVDDELEVRHVTRATTTHEYRRLAHDELVDFAAMLHTLTDDQWDHPSLCAGWNVRHVVGHICLGSTISPWSLPLRTARFGFRVGTAANALSFAYGEDHTPAELVAAFDRLVGHPGKPGLGAIIPDHEYFVDKVIHRCDMARPLALAHPIPAERLVATLDALPRIGGFLKSAPNARSLSLVATDVGHRVGTGPEVVGPAEALILAVSGRPDGLGELSGDGLPTLKARIQRR
jgi:uncharacterized protein (TIGR03083 family)